MNISPTIGSVSSSGSYSVTPSETTTYTLTATNEDGNVSASTTVTVAPSATTLNISSGSQMDSADDAAGVDNNNVLGLGFGDSNGMPSSWLPYLILIGLLALVAIGVIVFVTRKPAVAYSGAGMGTQVANLSCTTDTYVAGDTSHATSVVTGACPKLIAPDGGHIDITRSSETLGRKDLRPLIKADKIALISREHIRLTCEEGDYYIEDCNSTNGTKINGSSIKGKGRYLLKNGDQIQLADVITLTFEA